MQCEHVLHSTMQPLVLESKSESVPVSECDIVIKSLGNKPEFSSVTLNRSYKTHDGHR